MATSRPDGSYTLGMWAAASVHLPKLFEWCFQFEEERRE